MVWELREHDVDQVMREVRDAVRYWDEHPQDAEAAVRISLSAGRFDSPRLLASPALRLASSQALAAGQTDFKTIVSTYAGWKGRLERLYKRVMRKSTGWLFFQQAQANRALATAVVELAHAVGELSERVRQMEAELERRAGEPGPPEAGGR